MGYSVNGLAKRRQALLESNLIKGYPARPRRKNKRLGGREILAA